MLLHALLIFWATMNEKLSNRMMEVTMTSIGNKKNLILECSLSIVFIISINTVENDVLASALYIQNYLFLLSHRKKILL